MRTSARTLRSWAERGRIGNRAPRIGEDNNFGACGRQLPQQPKALWPQILGKVVYAGDVAPGSIEAVDETELYRIGGDAGDDGNRASGRLGRKRRCHGPRWTEDT